MIPHNRSENPFFIIGSGRCGTTLLRLLIDAHPRICIPPESHIFSRFSKIFHYYKDLGNETTLRLFINDLLNDVWIQSWQFDTTVDEVISLLPGRSITDCINTIFHLYAKRRGKSRWGDKTPSHISYIKEILELFPQALFIHLVRDGRDVAHSLRHTWIIPHDIYSLANFWRNRILDFNNQKHLIFPDNLIEIRYEDLVINPQDTMSRIFLFLGEKSIPIDIQIPDTPHKKGFNLSPTSMHAMLNEPISNRKIGVFRNCFTQRQIEIIESLIGKELSIYGYKPLTQCDKPINFIERMRFFLQRSQFRLLRFATQPFFVSGRIQLRVRNWLRKHNFK